MMAAAEGDLAVVDTLLAAGADPRAATADGTTALALAVSGGAFGDIERPLLGGCHTEVVRALLRRDPSLTPGPSRRAGIARRVARFNDCDEVLVLVDKRKRPRRGWPRPPH